MTNRLNLSGKGTLSSQFSDREVESLIGGGRDRQHFDLDPGMGETKQAGNLVGLPQRQRRPAGGQPELHDRSNSSLIASASRSPRWVPAALRIADDGPCNNLITTALVAASTASH